MDQHSFLSSPYIHSEKWIFGHAVCFAHQVSHTTHVVLIVSLHTKALIPVRPIEVGYLGAGRWLGQWIHHLIPFTTPPHFIPCSHLAQMKKDIIPNLSLNHQCLKFPSLSHVASEAIEQILLRWVKLERQPIGQKFCLGRDVSVYFFPTVMNKVKVILAWLWCPIFQMLATRWRASKVLGYLISTQSVQFSSVAQSYATLCDPMDCSMPGLPVHHHLPELTQTHVHWVGDTIQASHPLLSPSPPTFNLSQHQGLFQWVSSSHQVSKVLEFQLQHQSF